ncbi:MAG TPA: MMPL family transporter, partial [Candidatus Polarisedimenticolaceae bacterium]|nr:MMPL family transporter [Candidatus Polarisedimenticolaceae bacterium]
MLAVAASVSALAVAELPRLRLAADLRELLPETDPAARAYRLLLDRFGALDRVYVVVRLAGEVDDGGELLAEAACEIASALERSEWFASARCGPTERDHDFLLESVLPRAALLIPPDRLASHVRPEAIRERAAWMRAQLAGPLGFVEAPFFAADPLGLAAELTALSDGHAGLAVDPVSGVFLSRSGTRALVVATPRIAELDTAAGREMVRFLDETFREAGRAENGAIEFGALGGPLYAVHDETVIRGDVTRTAFGAAAGIAILLLLYFGSPRIPGILLVSVSAGIVWTAALMTWVRGEISVIGVSFAAILIGLGVDYGIHGASAFRETAAGPGQAGRAMMHVFATSGPAIVASAATTAAGFLVLVLADFWPVRELGLLVA